MRFLRYFLPISPDSQSPWMPGPALPLPQRKRRRERIAPRHGGEYPAARKARIELNDPVAPRAVANDLKIDGIPEPPALTEPGGQSVKRPIGNDFPYRGDTRGSDAAPGRGGNQAAVAVEDRVDGKLLPPNHALHDAVSALHGIEQPAVGQCDDAAAASAVPRLENSRRLEGGRGNRQGCILPRA